MLNFFNHTHLCLIPKVKNVTSMAQVPNVGAQDKYLGLPSLVGRSKRYAFNYMKDKAACLDPTLILVRQLLNEDRTWKKDLIKRSFPPVSEAILHTVPTLLDDHTFWTLERSGYYSVKSSHPQPGPIRVATISDGFDAAGFIDASSVAAYLSSLELEGVVTLEELLQREADASRPVRLLVFDAFLPWGRRVGRRLGLATAAFFTQSSAMDALYWDVWGKRVALPVRETVELPRLLR
ncbi:hypothetical protein Cni_G13175 [Canna indica]|uniref:Uncharacterized protein n=1 Tax=Canna indica TaxID=4628 RepID=A0AAQ3QB98_9LILI|nr:hypothetical protein Cni_G13175 [Canna indica]